MINAEEQMAKANREFVIRVISHCFNDCVHDFASKSLTQTEVACIRNCAKRQQSEVILLPEVLERIDSKFGDRY